MKELLTTKIGMTQIMGDEGKMTPVTVLLASPCRVIQVKTKSNDGYNAVQIGYGTMKAKKANRPQQGHFKAIGEYFKKLKEFKVENTEKINVGDVVAITMFQPGEKVSATGISIGKGFQGTVKRWNFSRGLMTHGSKSHRIPGSIGGHTEPGHVFKGKKMAGQMGNCQVTVKNLKIVRVDTETNVILVKGAVPGANGGLVRITKSGSAKV